MHGTTASETYRERLSTLESLQAESRRRDRVFGYTKLALIITGLASATFLVRSVAGIAVLGFIFLLFLAFLILQERVLTTIRLRDRALEFYRRGLARLNGSWKSSGEKGDRFLTADHPYARDLDIFGDASLFQYLSNANTRAGQHTLASWLLNAATADVISSRQAAVRELADRLELRQDIYVAANVVASAVEPEMLTRWGVSSPILSSIKTRVVITALALLWIASIVVWAYTGEPFAALLISVLNFAYSHRMHARAEHAAESIERAASDLVALSRLLRIIESGHFRSERLCELQATIFRSGQSASRAVGELARLAELIQSRHSLFMRPLDLFTFWSAQLLMLAEGWQRKHGAFIGQWIGVAGEVEALGSLAAFAFEHPSYAYPDIVAGAPVFDAAQIGHPLLHEHAVRNDVCFDHEHALIILSGPNMAGKSTFIRSIGVNAVLAQCGAPVCASRLKLTCFQVAASICVLDSLDGGISRFYAEIRRLKRIDDLTRGTLPVLFLLDELLSGTNSHDRLAGTEFVLSTFLNRGAMGIVSTHDLALTRIVDALAPRALNAHFEDHVEAGELVFDYKLKAGVVKSSNALKLMRAVGFGVPDASQLPPIE